MGRTSFFGVERRFAWFVLDGTAYAINTPTRDVLTPNLMLRGEAPEAVQNRSGIGELTTEQIEALALGLGPANR